MGGVSYTWDDRGNLTHDGTFTYTYSAAGRLVGAESVTHTLVYTYNGDGVRVGMYDSLDVYTFTQDLASALPSVLVETIGGGSILYLYGAGRLAEKQDGNGEWFLGDALGSVRQIADDDGNVALLRVYSPFGQLLSESGTGETRYGFTGEEYDASLEMAWGDRCRVATRATENGVNHCGHRGRVL